MTETNEMPPEQEIDPLKQREMDVADDMFGFGRKSAKKVFLSLLTDKMMENGVKPELAKDVVLLLLPDLTEIEKAISENISFADLAKRYENFMDGELRENE